MMWLYLPRVEARLRGITALWFCRKWGNLHTTHVMNKGNRYIVDVPRTHDPAKCRGRASSARRRDDGDDDATGTGLLLSTAMI